MKGRTRRPGGGRKPQGEFSGLTAPLTIRIPQDMRDQLEKAAKARGRNISQELMRRLDNSFKQDRKKSRDPALQAVCYLVGEVAEGVTNPTLMRLDNVRPLWRSHPFLFRAFTLAVGRLLDALKPAGEIKSPIALEIKKNLELDLTGQKFMRDIYRTPERLADFVAAGILRTLINPPAKTTLSELPSRWDDYGMASACHDLGLNPKGRKT